MISIYSLAKSNTPLDNHDKVMSLLENLDIELV